MGFTYTVCHNLVYLYHEKGWIIKRYIAFVLLMVWRDLTNDTNYCYFYFTPPTKAGLPMKKREAVQYPNLPSAFDVLHI